MKLIIAFPFYLDEKSGVVVMCLNSRFFSYIEVEKKSDKRKIIIIIKGKSMSPLG